MSTVERSRAESPQDYRHVAKLVRPAPPLELSDAVLKWYDVAPGDVPVPAEIRALARLGLVEAARTGGLPLGRGRLRHPAPLRARLLLPARLHVAQPQRALGDGLRQGRRGRRPLPAVAGRRARHRPTFCVWELGAVCHERRAWRRYLARPRDALPRHTFRPRRARAG